MKRIHGDIGGRQIYVYEVSSPEFWRSASHDDNPFGLKLWPGSVGVARHLGDVRGKRVLELAAGNGFTSLAAAKLGAEVLATDISEDALKLVQRAAQEQDLNVDTAIFDVLSREPLPSCDVLVVADTFYDTALASAVADRVLDAYRLNCDVLIGIGPARLAEATFLDRLSGLDFTSYPMTIELPDAKWKAKAVDVLHLSRSSLPS